MADDQAPTRKARARAHGKSGGMWETVRTVIYAALIALAIRTVAFEPFNIPSGSMIPTLLVGDYLFVSKYAYGYSRYSLPFDPPLFEGRVLFTPPERGDVVVFRLPPDPEIDYIKRVIGLPGDRIQVRGGILHINGKPVTREPVDPDGLRLPPGAKPYIETLPNGRRHLIAERTDSGRWDNTPVYLVPEGHYLMMGDNRDSSQDSRVFGVPFDASGKPVVNIDVDTVITKDTPVRWAVGFVPAENLIGRAEIIFFSVDGSAAWWEVWKWPFAVRFDRLFSTIQ